MSQAQPRTEPPFLRIAAEIRRRIESGQLQPGDRVPSARQITVEWDVAIATASKALAALREEGLVRAVPGVGTVVEGGRGPLAQRPARRRQPREPEAELSRERVVDAAIRVADAEGMAALSMRRVATELGIATMSVYRYVPGKDELVDLMADAEMGRVRLPDPPPEGWRAQLELVARLQWEHYKRHPWLAPALSMTRPQLLPNGIRHTEWSLRALSGLGLDPNTMLHAAVTLVGYVRGNAVNLEAEAEARQETGITDEQWMESQSSALSQLLAAGPYPTFADLMAQPGLDLDIDSLFEFGLRRLLDGLAALIERQGT